MTAGPPDATQSGHVDHSTRDGVSGWARDNAALDARATLGIVVNERLAGTIHCDLFRPDLQARGIAGDACHGFAFRFPQPLSPEHTHRVSIAFRNTGIGLAGSPATLHATAPSARLAPLLVTGAGRSGTTLLMSRLARSPDVCVARGYPFETMMLAYHAGLQHVLGAHAHRDAHNDVALSDGDACVGQNPFFDGKWFWQAYTDPQQLFEYYVGAVPHTLRAMSADLVEDFYRRVAALTGKGAPRFFAEKNNHLEPGPRRFARDLHAGTREIIITRDPRDLFLSQRAFFGVSEEQTLQGITADCAMLCALRRGAGADTVFVRYEDLVQQPRAEMARLERSLGIACPWKDTTDEAQQFTTHGTSATADRSIGRWRTELAPTLLAAINAACAAFLDTFGYR